MRLGTEDCGGGSVTQFLSGWRRSATYPHDPELVKNYVYAGSRLVGTVDGEGEIRHMHLDHLGTPRLVTNQSGVRVAFHEYEPFVTVPGFRTLGS